MIYVFDSDALVDLFNNYYPNRFPSLWKNFNKAVDDGMIISVREVYKEISDYGDQLSGWSKKNKKLFHEPTYEETVFITEIFKITHFQFLIRKKERLLGKPVADPFIIAKAKLDNGCVITQESEKPNAAKIPNVCKHFQIECTNLEGFMERENWVF